MYHHISRSILHGYFNPLVFWYQWEYLRSPAKNLFFGRVSKIGNDIYIYIYVYPQMVFFRGEYHDQSTSGDRYSPGPARRLRQILHDFGNKLCKTTTGKKCLGITVHCILTPDKAILSNICQKIFSSQVP